MSEPLKWTEEEGEAICRIKRDVSRDMRNGPTDFIMENADLIVREMRAGAERVIRERDRVIASRMKAILREHRLDHYGAVYHLGELADALEEGRASVD